ncbi:MAG: MFS transporter [Nevskia sp.]|nr:MFS transporter [Nevskia sp.]
MTRSDSGPPSPRQDDAYAALRFGEFRNLIAGVFLFTVAMLAQEMVLGYELYAMTHDPLVLGLTGLAEAVPFISLALFGGHFADRHERRRIIVMSLAFVLLGSAVLLAVTLPAVRGRLPQATLLLVIYGVIAALGLARGFLTPAAGSLTAFLVPREHYGNASAWRSTGWQGGAIAGPLFAGFLYSLAGLTATLAAVMLLTALALALFSRIRPRPPQPPPQQAAQEDAGIWQSLREGIDFVRRTPIILYSISLDLFSVLFGGVVAILPVFAADILHVGAQGLGVLRAASSVGAMLSVLACTRYPPTHRAWRNLLVAVTGFGVATLVFGLSRSFWLSVAALFMAGAFDSVSVVIRGTVLQVMPPDHLRGRVISVNSVFISASNELGAFESGLAARLLGTVPSVVFGGAMTLLTAAYVWRRSKALFAVRLE